MLHDEIFLLTPFLDGKMLDVNVLSTGSRTFLVDHVESSDNVNEQMCQARSKSIKHCENLAKMPDNLPTSHR